MDVFTAPCLSTNLTSPKCVKSNSNSTKQHDTPNICHNVGGKDIWIQSSGRNTHTEKRHAHNANNTKQHDTPDYAATGEKTFEYSLQEETHTHTKACRMLTQKGYAHTLRASFPNAHTKSHLHAHACECICIHACRHMHACVHACTYTFSVSLTHVCAHKGTCMLTRGKN